METEHFAKFIKENPHLFFNPDLTQDDRDTLENIFLCREKLLNEIKVNNS